MRNTPKNMIECHGKTLNNFLIPLNPLFLTQKEVKVIIE